MGSQWKRPRRTVCKTDYDDIDTLATSFYPKHCDQFRTLLFTNVSDVYRCFLFQMVLLLKCQGIL